MVPPVGLEPTTNGLQNRCSTIKAKGANWGDVGNRTRLSGSQPEVLPLH
jgi:hypothetical protein